jgi:hypothetical protein
LINHASRHDPNLAWFREARLGLFIHYSVVASRHGVSEHMQIGRASCRERVLAMV